MKTLTTLLIVVLCGSVFQNAVARDYPVTVTRVVDGDTVDVQIDLGLGVSKSERVRLTDVFAAERNEAGGREATDRLAAALRCAVAGGLTLRTDRDGRDKYGRLLGQFWCGDRNLNLVLNQQAAPAGKGLQ